MIGYFPIPYPDGFLYSLCARYQERVGTQFIGHVDQKLFGEIMWRHHFTFPHRIGYFLSQLSINMLGTAEDVIRKHTLFPFYLPFLGREKADQFIAGAIGDGVGNAASRLSGTKAGMRSKEDRMRYGEAYWHRIHQLPGLPVCPTHKTLLNTPVWHLPNRATERTYQSAEKSIPDEEEARLIDPNDPQSNLLLWISKQALWLLENECNVFDRKELVSFYRVSAALRGYERIAVIHTYSLRSGSGRALYGIFECECGFSYRRNAPDHGGSSRKKPILIHTTGHTWDDHLIQRWTDESVNVTGLSLQLGVSCERLLSEAGRLALQRSHGAGDTR